MVFPSPLHGLSRPFRGASKSRFSLAVCLKRFLFPFTSIEELGQTRWNGSLRQLLRLHAAQVGGSRVSETPYRSFFFPSLNRSWLLLFCCARAFDSERLQPVPACSRSQYALFTSPSHRWRWIGVEPLSAQAILFPRGHHLFH